MALSSGAVHFLLLILLMQVCPTRAYNQNDERELQRNDSSGSSSIPTCTSFQGDCQACVSYQCAFALGTCYDTCEDVPHYNNNGLVPAPSCYTLTLKHPFASDVCQLARDEARACTSQTSCEACVSTTKSFDGASCVWYESAKSCFPGGCGPFGCGKTLCDDAPVIDLEIIMTTTNDLEGEEEEEEGSQTSIAFAAVNEGVDGSENDVPQPPQSTSLESNTTVFNSEQEECCAACAVNSSSSSTTTTNNTNESQVVLRILTYGNPGMDLMNMQKSANAYMAKTGVDIQYYTIADLISLQQEIRSQAERHLPLYDGYICPPSIVGTAVQYDAFLDLTREVRTNRDLEWLDILRGYRDHVAVYDNRVYMLPLDGDALYLFYREDILDAYNLQVPRTWEEYWKTARAIHGRQFNGQTLVGSCVGKKSDIHIPFWVSLILASYTQTNGSSEGFMLDPDDLTPLLGEAIAEVLRQLELQTMYGHPDEFKMAGGGGSDSVNLLAMNEGICAMTYNFGDGYKSSYTADPQSQVAGLVRAAPAPGSDRIFNRETKTLEKCTEENCGKSLGGVFYEDIGWVNRAAYLAFGGWAAAINNNVPAYQQKHMVEFFSYMASPEVSLEAAIPNATLPLSKGNGVDPFRNSHLDTDEWVNHGYDRDTTESYRDAILDTLNSPNIALDMRFFGADLLYRAIDEEVYDYLDQAFLRNSLPDDEEERHATRLQSARKLTKRVREIIMTENAKKETVVPILEQYQRSLGIFKPDINNHTLDGIRPIGWALASFVMALSLGFAVWVAVNWNSRVVKGSQPEFLLLICFGCIVIASGVFPLGMDDGFFDEVGIECSECDKACQSWPWLFFIGFTMVFAAIFSKLWRLNRVVKSAKHFSRVTLKVKDVLLPFISLFLTNIVLLTVWNVVDPLFFEREVKDDLNTYGSCSTGTAGKVLALALAVLNICALLMAEVEAYKGRNISDHLSESKYIAIATFGMFQVFIIGVPVVFLVDGEPSASYFVIAGIIFVMCMGILLLIFVPKIIYNHKPQKLASKLGLKIHYNKPVNFSNRNSSGDSVDGQSVSSVGNSHKLERNRHNHHHKAHPHSDNGSNATPDKATMLQIEVDEWKRRFEELSEDIRRERLTNVDAVLNNMDEIEETMQQMERSRSQLFLIEGESDNKANSAHVPSNISFPQEEEKQSFSDEEADMQEQNPKHDQEGTND